MDLVTVVVVPARDEQDRIGTCLEALAAQTIGRHAFETILVADRCQDRTEQVARETAERLGLNLTILQGPGEGSGPARGLGMDAAAERLRSLGIPRGLIATTDADSEPAPDWLERQLEHLERGADVIAGAIELAGGGAELPAAVLDRRRRDAERRMAEIAAIDPGAAHHHFAGASLGVSADVYRQVGGIDATPALEDEAFAGALALHKIPILRPADVRVRTAVRTDGRAARGLSVDLAVSTWLARRRHAASEFELRRLRALPNRPSVTVVIPARECAATVAGVIETTVGPAYAAGLVDQVVVVDAASADGTADRAAAAGATVMQQDELEPELGPALGKGDAMWRALAATGGEIVCFLDADTEDPDPGHLLGLLGPLLTDPQIAFVKGAFARPFNAGGRALADEGGRVTELMARPLLNLHFPLLAGFTQPLAGEFAGRRRLLERLPFPVGYGIEIALLIDALNDWGLDALAECGLGSRQNRHQPLRALGEMAFAVLAAVERRIDGPRSATGGQFLRPWENGRIVRVPVGERPPLSCRSEVEVGEPQASVRL
ncbi:MAG: glucosyl-3-phosphoglycerate synthase [Solirubrobacteraceae bacterium]